MHHRGFVIATLALVCGSAAQAAAGTYVSLGIGGEPAVRGDMSAAIGGEGDGGNGRLALGLGLSRVALEGSLSRYAFGVGDATSLGAHLRLGVPILRGFGAYGRVGLERIWLGAASTTLGDDTSNGIAGGLGLEYRLRAPFLGEAGVWAEASQNRFATDMGTGGVRLWTAGLLVGL